MFPLFDAAAWAAPAPGGYEGTLGDGVEALWSDFWIHTDDIRAAVGRAPVADEGLAGAVSHVTFELGKRGWSGDVPSGEQGQIAWVLAATGRAPLARACSTSTPDLGAAPSGRGHPSCGSTSSPKRVTVASSAKSLNQR